MNRFLSTLAVCKLYKDCIGINLEIVTRRAIDWLSIPERVTKETCHVNTFDYTKGPECYGNTCAGAKPDKKFKTTNMMGVLKKRQSRSKFLPSRYNGKVPVKKFQVNAFDDQCRKIYPYPFGQFHFRNFGKVSFHTTSRVWHHTGWKYANEWGFGSNIPEGHWEEDERAYVSDVYSAHLPGIQCAHKCFSKAGCTAWWTTVEPESCKLVIGPTEYRTTIELNCTETQPDSTEGRVTESGRIDKLCPEPYIKNELYEERLYDWFYLGLKEEHGIDDPDELRKEIIANFTEETGEINQWVFKTHSENPPITQSQFIEMRIENIWVYDDDYDENYDLISSVIVGQEGFRVRATVKTHVRTGHPTAIHGRKRRAEEDSRAMMPKTEDMLAVINAITQEAFDYIEKIKFSDHVKLIAKTPIETVQLVQKTADGSIAADCSSGSCQCSKGFIDNGNGCTEMTPQQAATTPAPTTQAPTTPTQTRDWIQSLVDKIQEIFEADRPDKARPHLLKKWEKLSDKFIARYELMEKSGCDFADTYDDDSMRTVLDFDTIDACRVSEMIIVVFFRPYTGI